MPRGKEIKTRESIYERPGRLPRILYKSQHGGADSGLRSKMGLEDDKDAFQTCIAVMGKRAKQFFSDGLPITKQPAERVKLFMSKVCKDLPLINKYEDRWPASAYLRIWLRHQPQRYADQRRTSSQVPLADAVKREKAKNKGHENAKRTPVRATHSEGTQPRATAPAADGDNAEASLTQGSHNPRVSRTAPLSRRVSHRSIASSATIVSTPSRAAHIGLKSSSSRTTTAADVAAAAPDGAGSGASIAPVRDFLRTLAQPLDCLLPAFRAIGVVDAASLRGLVRMEGWYVWLHRMIMMDPRWAVTELQWKRLTDALVQLALKEEES